MKLNPYADVSSSLWTFANLKMVPFKEIQIKMTVSFSDDVDQRNSRITDVITSEVIGVT